MSHINNVRPKIPNLMTKYLPDGSIDKEALRLSFLLLDEVDELESYFLNGNYPNAIRVLQEAWSLSSTYLVEKIGVEKLINYLEMTKNLLMSEEEVEYIESLNDELIVFRGSKSNLEIVTQELSWTSSLGIAANYAINRTGYINKGFVKKENILCAFFDESEYIIRPNSVTIIERYFPKEFL